MPALSEEESVDFVFPGGVPVKHKVGRFPHPNTLRTDGRYRHRHTSPWSATAHRRLFCWTLDESLDPLRDPDWSLFGHWDVTALDENTLVANVIENEFGWKSNIQIKSFDSLPVNGTAGIEWLMTLTHTANGDEVTVTREFEKDVNPWRWDTDAAPVTGPPLTETRTPDFPYAASKAFDWAMSDCFPFTRAAPAPIEFAEFNSTDASILFDAFTNTTTQRIQLEFDVRIHPGSTSVILGRGVNTTRNVKLAVGNIVWRTSVIPIVPDLPLDVWHTIRLEFNWNDPGTNWKVYVDGLLRGVNASSGATSQFFNTMGRRGNFYEGVFDMKNLTLQDTDPAAPRLLLSTELRFDACDIGEKSLKGTTENMFLPSCP